MEKRRRNKSAVDSESTDQTLKSSSEITFDAFFIKSVNEGKLKAWQRFEIETFFSELNLRQKEDLEVYEQALKKY